MVAVSLQCVEGVDKGKAYRDLQTPVTLGREEGNSVRLNDERVSRFHAKIQEDHGQIVLTDLDSTNGTRVNGEAIQLRLLRPGDRVNVGRSVLVFGTMDQIAETLDSERQEVISKAQTTGLEPGQRTELPSDSSEFLMEVDGSFNVFDRSPPMLPARLSPAQAAQLSEVIDYLHRALAEATRPVHIPPKAKEAVLPHDNWQQVQAVLSFLASYSRQVSEPEDVNQTTDEDED